MSELSVPDAEPDWIAVLRAEADRTSRAKAGRRIGYKATTVSQILSGTYTARPDAIQKAVEGALMSGTLDCPVLGTIATDQCLTFQKRPLASAHPARVKLARTCPGCPHSRITAKENDRVE